jgi:oxygen-independent coproporphyrinogen-3 oxidase
MAGFYIHIPFCKKVCYYCDFHFVATLKHKDEMLKAIKAEIRLRSAEWEKITFDTLYFGGGTPSVLSDDEINLLVEEVLKNYTFSNKIEFTLEANPDDLTYEYLKKLKTNTQVNRLSIGTQSFHNSDLELMNRRHTSQEAVESIKIAQDIGYSNLNIDLIYGVPRLSLDAWEKNIQRFIELGAPHLSAYHLTFEPKTVFDHMRKKNKLTPVSEKISQQHYNTLVSRLKHEEFVHYEVSNFTKDGYYSKHNTNYWKGKNYLGIGPSAHSFLGEKRWWNISNNTKYCESLSSDRDDYYTIERLDVKTKFNEYIITALRTIWGVNFEEINIRFGETYLNNTQRVLSRFIESKHYTKTKDGFALTEEGWLISDFIMREFMAE